MIDPVTMPCKHIMCEDCASRDDKVRMTTVPLESVAKTDESGLMKIITGECQCPCCPAVGHMKGLPSHNSGLSSTLQALYPRQYAERGVRRVLAESKDNIQTLTMQVGNWHNSSGPERHIWTFFVKSSRTDIIKEVHIRLHESVENSHIIHTQPPYIVHAPGSRQFPIRVEIVLIRGYAWMLADAVDGVDGAVKAVLKFDWTLDFHSSDGNGAMARCRVKVKREKRASLDPVGP